MRGKKSDPEFVSGFITKCIRQGIAVPNDIVQAAKAEIKIIDDKIKETEMLKATRSKLLDVIATFDKPANKTEEAKLLPFFKLQYPQICRKICKHIVDLSFNSVYSVIGLKDPEVLFCIKQLIEAKIIARVDDYLVRGDKFDEYLKFVLCEVE
jgi:hypothetical protein